MAVFGTPFRHQIEDINGDPVSGALVNTYAIGTTTRQAVFVDAELNVPATNPVVADSSGLVVIYFNPLQDYSVAITDPTGATNYGQFDQTAATRSGAVAQVESLTALAGLSTPASNTVVFLLARTAGGTVGAGLFEWSSADLSTDVTNDPERGLFVPPTSDTTGASGAWVRQYDGLVSPQWFGALFDDNADDTSALRAAIATGFDLGWPAGVTRIVGQLDAEAGGAWYGAGPGNSLYNSDHDGSGTMIRLVGANSNEPFILPPRVFKGFHIDGIDKQGVAIGIGSNGRFIGGLSWDQINIRRAALGVDMYNTFYFNAKSVNIHECTNGLRHTPTDSAEVDDGYSTTVRWDGWNILSCDGYGLDIAPALVSGTWVWDQVVIERNAATAGDWQARLQNIRLTARGVYLEGTPGKPGIHLNSTWLQGSEWFFNGTGGVDFDSAISTLLADGFRFVSATDIISNVASNARLFFRFSTLRTDIRGWAATRLLDHCSIEGVGTDLVTRLAGLRVGQSPGAAFQPGEARFIYCGTFTVDSLVLAAGARHQIVTNKYFPGIWHDAVGHGSVQAYQRDIDVIVSPATTGSFDYISVDLRNNSASPVTLTAVKVNVIIVRARSPADLTP